MVPKELPQGDVFVVDPRSSCNVFDVETPIENPITTEQDAISPLMRHIKLDNVIVPEARKVSFLTDSVHTLASTVTNEIIFAELRYKNGRPLVLTVDLDSSDLAFRTSFPILVSNVLQWHAKYADDLQPASRTGELLELNVTEIWSDRESEEFLFLKAPGEQSQSLPVTSHYDEKGTLQSATCTLGPFDKVGIWDVVAKKDSASGEDEGRIIERVAVNLSSVDESDTRILEKPNATPATASVLAGYLSRPLWFYLALLALLLFGVEWCLYQRRVIA